MRPFVSIVRITDDPTLTTVTAVSTTPQPLTQLTITNSAQAGQAISLELCAGYGSRMALTSGGYVYHCHHVGHEDNGMMGQFQVLPPPFTAPTGTPTPTPAGAAVRLGPMGPSEHGGR